jgi:hypothetical protein
VDLTTVAMLRAPAGTELLAALPRYDEAAVLSLGARLRERYPAELVAAALTQARLRERAARRLGPIAYELLWTPDAAQQATRRSVADWRAGRMRAGGVRRVLDLGAGAGGDALALAAVGIDVIAVERDPVVAAVLTANAAVAGAGRIRVVQADVAETAVVEPLLADCDAVFADPARRIAGRRVLDPAGWSPSLRTIGTYAARVRCAAAKVGPGIDHDLLPDGVTAEWVSEHGDVLECALWWGGLRGAAPRSATVLGSSPDATRTLTGTGARAEVRPAGRFLHEPDGAVIRAGLVAEVAVQLDGGLLDPSIAYISTDADVTSPWTTRYAVTDVLPFSVKALRALLRARGVGRLVIKKRGTAVTPEQLRPQLRLAGPREATVVLTRVGRRPYALLVEPLPSR